AGPEAGVYVSPNAVDAEALAPPTPPSEEDRVVFAAVFNYAPSADGAVWFARHVWPRVRAARPGARLTLAGSSPTRTVRQLADEDESIEVTGAVADIRPFLWRSAIAVAPIFQARGVQNKVLEAAAAGLPSVVTPAVWKGLPSEVLPACRVADDADQFAARLDELLAQPPAGRRFGPRRRIGRAREREAVRQQQHHRPRQRSRLRSQQRRDGVVPEERGPLQEAPPLVAGGVARREPEHVALPDVLRRPRFGRVFENLRLLKVGIFALGH